MATYCGVHSVLSAFRSGIQPIDAACAPSMRGSMLQLHAIGWVIARR
jgi:hypothetical protein